MDAVNSPVAPLDEEALATLQRLATIVAENERIPSPWHVRPPDDEDVVVEVNAANNVFIVEGPNDKVAEYIAACSPSVILAILTEVRESRRDTQRVDWLQENAVRTEPVMDMDPEAEVGWYVIPYDAVGGEGATLRDAIDAAQFGAGKL